MTSCESLSKSEKKSIQELLDSASYGAMQLSLAEVFLGSFLHALHIPFSGFLLSLNQCFILNRSLLLSNSTPSSASLFLPMTISNTAAIIKTLSPYGKKFTPMLAISMQGSLFNLGILIFGNNLAGRCIGSLFLSLWPMLQPALIYGIIYGSIFLNMVVYYKQIFAQFPWFDNIIHFVVVGYIFMHLCLSLGVCLLVHFLPARFLDDYDRYIAWYAQSHLSSLSELNKTNLRQKIRGVWKDFTSPIFLLSLVLSGFFLYATVNSLESFCFVFFRLIAVAFLTFFLIRNISAEACVRLCSKFNLLKAYTPYVEEVLRRVQSQKINSDLG